MIAASLYIVGCSARNRIRMRLRRLREPRYLIGAIVGVAYFYFGVFARLGSSRASATRRRTRAPASPEALAALTATGPALAGLGLMVITAASWILPVDSGLLDFSNAEIQFLFPAPVSRRSLLIHRLLRSQLGILFGALIVGLVAPSLSGYTRLRIGVGMWLLLCVGKVYYTGLTLSRARLTAGDSRVRRTAWLPLVVIAAAFTSVGLALFRAFSGRPIDSFGDLLDRIGQVSTTGVSSIVMWPFVALARPLFAPWPWPFLGAFGTALLILAAITAWVLQSDATFEDAAEQATQAKERSRQARSSPYTFRGGLQLAPAGRAELLFAWKAATQTMRTIDVRLMLRLLPLLVAIVGGAASTGMRAGAFAALAMFGLIGTAFALLLAPQAIRLDMRQDLQHLDVLKTWPLRASAVVRGEMLWPGVLVTVLAWTMIAIATALSGGLFGRVGLSLRLSLGAAAFVVAPGLAFAQLAIHNGVALLFPAWVPTGGQRPRGVDAMGQRIIMLGGTWLALIVMTLPGAIAGGIVWFAFNFLIGRPAIVAGAAVCCVILLIEVLVMTEMLGPAYERLDALAVDRPEQ